MKSTWALAFFIFFVSNSKVVQANTALDMQGSCEALINDTRVIGGGQIIIDRFSGGEKCFGAFLVIQRVSSLVHEEEGGYRSMFNVCPPEESTLMQLVRIHVNYVNDNPRRLHDDFFFVALDGIREAFPC